MLKIILADRYTEYEPSLVLSGLKTLPARRVARSLAFAKRCLTNDQTKHFSPLNPDGLHDPRHPEKFRVNFSHTENYRNSIIPYCQRLLNADNLLLEERKKMQLKAKEQQRAKEQVSGSREQETGARE